MDTVKKLVQDGLNYVKEGNWASLLEASEQIQLIEKDNFYGYYFMFAGELEYDFVSCGNNVHHTLNPQHIEYDLKTRLYHEARNLYSRAPKFLLEQINNLYPDETNDEGIKTKAQSYFDIRYDYFKQLEINIGVLNKKYLAAFQSSAKGNNEKAIVESYKNWNKNVKYAVAELNRYDKAANEYIQEDCHKTAKRGNAKLFFGFLFLTIFFFAQFFISLIAISFEYYRPVSESQPLGKIMTGVLAVILLISTISFTSINPYMKKHKIHALALGLFVFFVGCVGLSTAFTLSSHIGKSWFLMFASAIFFFLLFPALYYTFMFRPRPHNQKIKTLLGDEKSLLNDTIEFAFDFDWEENKVIEDKPAKANAKKTNKEVKKHA